MGNYDGWETLGPPIGEGGQGKVYKARNPKRVAAIQASLKSIAEGFNRLSGQGLPSLENLMKLVADVGGPDDVRDLGALKVFKIFGQGPERDKAFSRLNAEIRALLSIQHPGVLRLLHSRAPHLPTDDFVLTDESFIVTEYHPRGTLDKHLDKYKGGALEALLAFKPLVQAVAEIHENGAIHRDIKTENMFVATDGRLVLGDFGIVFFADEQRTRLTDVYGERVGSHFWMAPWAYEPVRLPIDEIKPSLDIFPLGKVPWSMIAGRDGPLYWGYDRPGNDLKTMFPEVPAMQYVNEVLSHCIVREERDCAQTAEGLLVRVDEAIDNIIHLDPILFT
jgi:serine/threonine protein kinase